MRRGDIWTVAGGPDYLARPRPAVIIQEDACKGTSSVTICPLTTFPEGAPLLRREILPNETNGLNTISYLMADKVSTVPRAKLGRKIGAPGDSDMIRVNSAIIVFLGLASSVRAQAR